MAYPRQFGSHRFYFKPLLRQSYNETEDFCGEMGGRSPAVLTAEDSTSLRKAMHYGEILNLSFMSRAK